MQQKISKICIVGDPAVGKTSLIRRFVFNKYEDKYISTLGTKISRKSIIFNEQSVDLTMMIWDMLGQRDYKILHASAFKGAKGAFIVCDLTRKETFESITYWRDALYKISHDIPLILIGNKSDLENEIEVDEEMLKELADEFKQYYFVMSAKTGDNVEKAFHLLGSLMLEG